MIFERHWFNRRLISSASYSVSMQVSRLGGGDVFVRRMAAAVNLARLALANDP